MNKLLDTMNHTAKDLKYLMSAFQWANVHSKDDPETRVGALALGSLPTDIAVGYNGLPPGIKEDHRFQDRDMKSWMTVHAEVNALANARDRFDVQTLYVTHAPCKYCAAQILCMARLIERVVVIQQPGYDTKWHNSTYTGRELLEEASVLYLTVPWDEFRRAMLQARESEDAVLG